MQYPIPTITNYSGRSLLKNKFITAPHTMGTIFDRYKILHGLPIPGQTITYVKPTKASWFKSVVEDEKNLELGEQYTVEKTELNSSSTYVWLKEFYSDKEPCGFCDDRIPFFNLHAFEWTLPELEMESLKGFSIHDMRLIKTKYGFGFEDTEGKTLIEGNPIIILDYDELGTITSAMRKSHNFIKIL